MEYARRAAGARGVAATLRRSLGRVIFLAARVVARGSGLRPGPPREPWVELVAVLRGTGDFVLRRWGPPPANLPGLGDMSLFQEPVRTPLVRVLHLGPDPRMGGGMSAVVRGLLASPLGQRYRLDVVPTYRHRDPMRRLAWFCVALVRLAIWSLAGRGRLVHIHTTMRGSMYRKSVCTLVAKALRRRVVVHIHAGVGDLEAFDSRIRWPSRTLFRHAFARADVVLSVSDASAREVSRAFGRHDILVIPNAAPRVDAPPRADAAVATDPLLLYLGGFANPAKGGDVLLEALRVALTDCPELRVALAGPGDLPPEGRALVQGSPRITWRSWLDEPRKAAALSEADLVVIPSRSEGLPVSLLEAMAHGRAIVATAVGGMSEILTDGVDAILVKPEQPLALAGAVCGLARDPDRRLRLGASARSRAQRLNDHDVSDRLDALYRELLRS
jgi:glycosyltransferase involved in cell wall biosynthesis